MAHNKEGGDKPERSKQPSKKAPAESRHENELPIDAEFVSDMSPHGAEKGEGYLAGQLLVAMPNMRDPRFERTVIYMCVHNAEGAMGLVINKAVGSLTFPQLLRQLGIPKDSASDRRVHFGGPVEMGRGFVLHTDEYEQESTVKVRPGYAVTATIDILKAIAEGGGPEKALLALGYAGWAPGQLDGEITANGWLHAPADLGIVFDDELDTKWTRAISKIGIDLALLSGEAGHA
jgi:putative transcriptional regulator